MNQKMVTAVRSMTTDELNIAVSIPAIASVAKAELERRNAVANSVGATFTFKDGTVMSLSELASFVKATLLFTDTVRDTNRIACPPAMKAVVDEAVTLLGVLMPTDNKLSGLQALIDAETDALVAAL